MKNLVTGGAGFIGSHIVEELLRRGERVRVLDTFSTGRPENLQEAALGALGEGVRLKSLGPGSRIGLGDQLEVIHGDVRDAGTVREALEGVEFVFHEAAIPSVPRSVSDPVTCADVNVIGTVTLLKGAKDQGLAKVIMASSSSVYGEGDSPVKREDMPARPISPYGASKLACDIYGQVFSSLFGLKVCMLRYFNVFGPRQDPASPYSAVIPKFIGQFLRGESPIIYGDGEQSRDFTYVGNVVEANLLAARMENGWGEIFNVACGTGITVNRLASELRDIFNSPLEFKHEPPRPGDIRHSVADISRAEAILGYKVSIGLREGLERTAEYFSAL